MSLTTAKTYLPSVKDHVPSSDIFTEVYTRNEGNPLSEQKQELDDIHQAPEGQLRLVSKIEEGNAEFRAQYEEAISTQAQLSAQLEALTIEHKKAVQDLSEVKRRNALLKKDNRAREQVRAHNVRLKVTLQRHLRTTTKTIPGLQNALKVAMERIEALESRGMDLLHALERQNMCLESNDKDKAKDKTKTRVTKAKLAFRDTLAKKWSLKLKPSLDDLRQD
ncbi:hypothetical protein yc1106_07103 [Curvularia clavata]|uniref:Uncharacterized protein n=1 Tax=Curvularia clavata TaxID=95742 RepID=A0A9Q8ZBY2_CURCL|nr:hypothetical protein yc1106_07103 [Curvularia clavata]